MLVDFLLHSIKNSTDIEALEHVKQIWSQTDAHDTSEKFLQAINARIKELTSHSTNG